MSEIDTNLVGHELHTLLDHIPDDDVSSSCDPRSTRLNCL
jgi:hypothetical protein